MGGDPTISTVCTDDDSVVDVVFVHGLTGQASETWTNESGEYWPQWLCDELPGVAVYALGYPASIFAKWAKKEMDLHERANNMLFQPRTNRQLAEEDVRQMLENVSGFFQILDEWERTERESERRSSIVRETRR